MEKLKVLSLFSGIAMFDLGLELTDGFKTIAFCELDKDCQKVLKKHWPEVPILNDIRKVNCIGNYLSETVPDDVYGEFPLPIDSSEPQIIDVVTASWPCQGHSVAGKKRGLEDERSGLWKEVKRVLQETNATWFIGENSANLRTNGLTEVLQDLWEIGFHNIRWDVLPAEAYGAIHKRERIYIVANRNGIRLDEATYAPTKEESNRRTKAWTHYCNRRCPEPRFYKLVNDDSNNVERCRKQRVKQSGNSLIYVIPMKIGEYILTLEKERKNK